MQTVVLWTDILKWWFFTSLLLKVRIVSTGNNSCDLWRGRAACSHKVTQWSEDVLLFQSGQLTVTSGETVRLHLPLTPRWAWDNLRPHYPARQGGDISSHALLTISNPNQWAEPKWQSATTVLDLKEAERPWISSGLGDLNPSLDQMILFNRGGGTALRGGISDNRFTHITDEIWGLFLAVLI